MNTEVIINGISVPYISAKGIGINKKINAEAAEIGSRSGNSTYTIEIPGSTEGVRTLFNNLFDVNIEQGDYNTFTPPRINTRLKAPAQVYKNKLLQFSGYARLSNIVISERGKIIFQVVLYGGVPDLFLSMGEKNLNEVDLAKFDHAYTVENIYNSWETSIMEHGVSTPFELGNGYVYPMIDYGENNEFHKKPNNWYWHHWKPAVYVKSIVDKIFEDAGINYTSDFFNSDYFKKLIIPYSNGDFRISEDEVTAREFLVNRTGTPQTITINTARGGTNYIIFNNDVTDPSGIYNNTTGVYQTANGGNYSFYYEVTFRFQWTGASGLFVLPTGVNIEVQQRRGGAFVKTIGTVLGGTQWSTQPVNTGDYSDPVTVAITTSEAEFLPGDEAVLYPVKVQPNAPNFNIEIQTTSYFGNLCNAEINYGETINISQTLPEDFKQKDFFAGLIKMFNLYFDEDTTKVNTLIVEPRPSFYQNENIDLTNIFDIEKECEIKPQGLAKYRSYLFTYAGDDDFYNKDYTTRTNETYGQLRVGIANEFLGDEYEITLPFASTPLISQLPTNRVISPIFFKDNSGNIVNKAAKPRILFYGGVLSLTNLWNLYSPTGFTSYQSYPYAGHHDSPYNPDEDLLFFPPKIYYFGGAGPFAGSITNQNLYIKNYYQHIQEINGENSFTALANFNIQPDLFLQMGLQKLYFFKNAYWRLLEIEDYSVDVEEVTQCHFVKALGISPIAPATKLLNGGTGAWQPIPGDDVPTPGLLVPPQLENDGVFVPGSVLTTSGRNNLIAAGNVVLGDNVDGVVVLGGRDVVIDSNTQGGLYLNVDFTDSDFIGNNPQASGLTAISGETVFIGGTVNVSGDTMFDKPVAYRVGMINTSDSPYYIVEPVLICTTDSGDIDVYLPTPTQLNGRNKQYVITKRETSHHVNIYAQGGAFIYHSSGVDNPLPITARQSIIIIYDGVSDWQVIATN